MEHECIIQIGVCRKCEYESIVFARPLINDDEVDPPDSGIFCPRCGETDLFEVREEFDEATYRYDDDVLREFSECMSLETCAQCGYSLVLSGDNRSDIRLKFRVGGMGTSYEKIAFCKRCLQVASQNELIDACSARLCDALSSCMIDGESAKLSRESIEEAFKTREIV